MHQNTLPVMEQFYTIQGEGFHQGRAAWFIRLGGCDVGCTWCDVKESWPPENHPQMSVEEIVEAAVDSGSEICVITGGEPLMYNLRNLTDSLQKRGLKTHVETSGAYAMSGAWDWVCFSPKKFKQPAADFPALAQELKVIVYNKSDFKWAEEFAGQVSDGCLLFLQPEWSREKEMTPLIIEYVKQNPRWQISLQVHKYMNIP